MDAYEESFTWELDGRLPVLQGGSHRQLTPEEASAVRAVVDHHGVVLLRGFDVSGDEFLIWAKEFCGGQGFTRLAPGANDLSGPRIGLHTEDAMLPFIPAWLWFYAAKAADRGGDTILCDGASVVSCLSEAALSFLAEDILYWWRSSRAHQPGKGSVVTDPPGIDRRYRGPLVEQTDGYLEITAVTSPIIRSRVGGHRVFANHILNSIEHDDDGGPPRLDGFHRVRTRDRNLLPSYIVHELQDVTSSLRFSIHLEAKEMLWLDNTRFLHGREAFEGSRYIVVHKGYHASQLRLRQRARA